MTNVIDGIKIKKTGIAYDIAGGSGPVVDKPYVLTADIKYAIQGKCLDVDALIDLMDSIDPTILNSSWGYSVKIVPLNNTQYVNTSLISFDDTSGMSFGILDESVDYFSGDTLRDALIENKNKIESYIISNFYNTDLMSITVPLIDIYNYTGDDNEKKYSVLLTLDQVYSIFKNTTSFDIFELKSYMYGKHIDVAEVISLIDSKDATALDGDRQLDINISAGNTRSGMCIISISCGSSSNISLFNNEYEFSSGLNSGRDMLLENKNDIEAKIVQNGIYVYSEYAVGCVYISSDSGDEYPITLNDLKALFVADND